MEPSRPLATEGAGSRRSSLNSARRRSVTEEFVEGGRRCTVAGDDFEAFDTPFVEDTPAESQGTLSEQVESLRRSTLLDPAYVEQLQQEEPGHLAFLRTYAGLLVQILLFSVFVGLDCSKSIFSSIALKGGPKIVAQSIPISQCVLQIALGLGTTFQYLGIDGLRDAFNVAKIIKYSPVALVFAASQAFNVLAYTALSAGTVKILGQVRLLQTALLSKLLLGRTYMITQWTVILMIVGAALTFFQGKGEWDAKYDCYKSLETQLKTTESFAIPKACQIQAEAAAESNSSEMLGIVYVFIYLFLSDMGSIVSEKLFKDEADTPYYLQKVWQEVGGLPCGILMSIIVPLGQRWLGLPEKVWRHSMWWTSDEQCSDQDWVAQGNNRDFCGGLYLNWRWAVIGALVFSTSQSWFAGLIVKKLNSVMKLLGKCASLALVFFLGDCWLLRKKDPATVCVISALMVMLGTYTFMNLKPPPAPKPSPAATESNSRSADVEMSSRG